MGQSTRGYVNQTVSASDIFNVIQAKFDKDAVFSISTGYDGKEIGHIYFNYIEEDRKLFYCVGEIDTKEKNIIDFNDDEYYSYLSFNYWGSAEVIMAEIVGEFGGYMEKNDCDEEEAFYIPKSSNFNFAAFNQARQPIIDVLDKNIDSGTKSQIASQVLKHKEELLNLLQNQGVC